MMRLVYFLQIFETIFSPQRFSFRCSMKQCVCAFLCNATQKLLFCEISGLLSVQSLATLGILGHYVGFDCL